MSDNLYTEPKIYDAKGDISKRWYVYFYYRNPETGKMKKQKPIFKGANRFKTKHERMEVLNTYRNALFKLLNDGFSPYDTNEQTQARLTKHRASTDATEKIIENTSIEKGYTIKRALAFALEQRESDWTKKSAGSIKGHYNRFMEWLMNNDLLFKDISVLEKSYYYFYQRIKIEAKKEY